MKISKLFHWLYAILMLLPILVFIPNAFYYGFNEHAVAQEKTEQVPVYYNSNVVESYSDMIIGNVYTWNNNLTPVTQSNYINIFNIKVLNGNFDHNLIYKMFVQPSGNLILQYQSDMYVSNRQFDFLIVDDLGGARNLPSSYIEKFSICNNKYFKEYQPLTTNMSITDSMSYAWDSVWQNDLFSWSYGSFLSQPFIYIGSVFNLPVDNALYYALSYWLDISIIWLVFDVIMYVPLLVHRWLDKGIIE